jgi:hypothetical protein
VSEISAKDWKYFLSPLVELDMIRRADRLDILDHVPVPDESRLELPVVCSRKYE